MSAACWGERAERNSFAANVPSIAEQGYPGFDVSTWYGLFMPARTPQAMVDTVHQAVNKLLATPEMQKAIHDQGAEPQAMTAEAFGKQVTSDYHQWGKIVRDAGVKIE